MLVRRSRWSCESAALLSALFTPSPEHFRVPLLGPVHAPRQTTQSGYRQVGATSRVEARSCCARGLSLQLPFRWLSSLRASLHRWALQRCACSCVRTSTTVAAGTLPACTCSPLARAWLLRARPASSTQTSAPARLQLSIAPPATACVHSAARVHGSDGSSVELMPGIEQDERANPNQFISAVIKPILTMVHRRHEATSVALSSVSWAEGMARASGRPVVDLGSSKCALLLPTTYPSP